MRFVLFMLTVSLLAGCASVPERVSRRFAAPTPQERVMEADEERTYRSAQLALRRLGYQLTKTAEAQGIIDAQSRLIPTERFGSSDQYVMELRLRPLDGSTTRVTAQLYELSEGQLVAGATSTPIAEHGRYDLFFDLLQSILNEDAAHQALWEGQSAAGATSTR